MLSHKINSVSYHLRNYQTVFQSGCTILCSHQQCMKVLIYPHTYQKLLCECFLLVIHVNVVSHCHFDFHFLMANDIEHLSVCLLTIYIAFLEKRVFIYFSHFAAELFVLLELSCKSSLF